MPLQAVSYDHGTRASYQRLRCGCVRCRAAEAAYRARLRLLHAHGQQTLGQRTSATEARRLVRVLQAEALVTRQEIAAALGARTRRLRLHTPTITWRKALKIRRLARLWLGYGPDVRA